MHHLLSGTRGKALGKQRPEKVVINLGQTSNENGEDNARPTQGTKSAPRYIRPTRRSEARIKRRINELIP